MISMEEMEQLLNEISESFPQELFKDLNGGIVLSEETKLHEKRLADDLYVLGEYHRGGTLGRYISIYYGSVARMFGHLPLEQIKLKLTEVLKHEFLHHLESLAGEYGLEVKDEHFLQKYYKDKGKQV